jgi:glucose-1-phosphate cytidylyltransferase
MKIYTHHGLTDFIICCGYKGHLIKEYFANYFLSSADVTFDIKNNRSEIHHHSAEPWRVTLVNTGDASMTGGRIKRIRKYVGDETFCLTYGDGVTNLDIGALIKFHQAQKTHATLTAVQPPGRYGAFALEQDEALVRSFREKPGGDGAWINGGYFVLEPQIFDLIDDDSTVWEQQPLQRLAHKNQLSAYKHTDFWQSMDTLRDKLYLEDLWSSGNPPWKVW